MVAKVLSTRDWLDLALSELSAQGYPALKAQPLAEKLGVTRGSFYHHFDSLSAFHAAVINHWAQASSGAVIAQAQAGDDPAEALRALLRRTLRSGEGLERAMRAWATADDAVANAIAGIDAKRIAVAEELLAATGLNAPTAAARARLLYWAAIGRLMLPEAPGRHMSEEDITAIANHMLLH